MTDSREKVPVDEADEESAVFVVDPDDYMKTRKLKEIADAKEHVWKLRRNRDDEMGNRQLRRRRNRIAEAVAGYGTLLLPLIEDALEKGAIESDMLVIDQFDIRGFVECEGALPTDDGGVEIANMPEAMKIYRRFEAIERELGLGLDIDEETKPAQI